MLRTFFVFKEAGCDPIDCTSESCSFPRYESALPAIQNDVVKFILSKNEYNFWAAKHLEVVLVDLCGENEQELVHTISETVDQYFITATIPNIVGAYRFAIKANIKISVVSFTNETSPGACDAILTVEIQDAPAEVFEFSVDGINWAISSTFTDLCVTEDILVQARIQGDTCPVGQLIVGFSVGDCSSVNEPYLYDFKDEYLYVWKNCELNDFIS
jgi:hypothetical protein